MKRAFDIVASIVGLVLLGLPIAILALAIRRNTPGPGILRQERVGRNRIPFICYKLRTMDAATRTAATHDTPAAAVTDLGAKLRRYKLDELPQLWNVLKGDMSFVGPRPGLPIQDDVIAERERRGVYAIRPGITGLSQVNDIDMSEPERLAVSDAEYMTNRTFLGDMRIIVRTLLGSGQGDHVRE